MDQQLNQRNQRCPEDQHDELDNDEQNKSHLPTGDQQEREDHEESNVPNRRDELEDTSPSSEMEINTIFMAQDMQMIKRRWT